MIIIIYVQLGCCLSYKQNIIVLKHSENADTSTSLILSLQYSMRFRQFWVKIVKKKQKKKKKKKKKEKKKKRNKRKVNPYAM